MAERWSHNPIDRSEASTEASAGLAQGPPGDELLAGAARNLRQIDSLLGQLAESSPEARARRRHENRLAVARLGIASSLFAALRAKHAPTASHSLRVALICSTWAGRENTEAELRDELEVAALLHDIGKLGISDATLRTTSALTPDQTAEVQRAQAIGLQVLAHSVPDHVLKAIANVCAWFDGSRTEYLLRGEAIPLSSRMIRIADIYDTMTTDTVFRKAMPQERAIAELFQFSGTQFDPQLVKSFAVGHAAHAFTAEGLLSNDWLERLLPEQADALWRLRLPEEVGRLDSDEMTWFLQELLDGLHDAIMFLGVDGHIMHWSRGAEELTGIAAQAMEHRKWQPEIVRLRDAAGTVISAERCPLQTAMHRGVCVSPRMLIWGVRGEYLPVDVYVLPVYRPLGVPRGSVVVFRDASSQTDLETRVQHLHVQATTDPLTGVANRAEFDRNHAAAVERHLQQRTHYSLIICDIDRFKSINDKYGHQAGDQALVSFTRILNNSCRGADLVARYGGEEFVMLCQHCAATEATQLAEKIRLELSRTPLSELNGQSITASFGVTELQAGDSAETMLRRADRGLLRAKDAGRNRVIQLGTGMQDARDSANPHNWWSWFRARSSSSLTEGCLSTNVPLQVAVEKLRGFIADHEAEILSLQGHEISLRLATPQGIPLRRDSDRPVLFIVHLKFVERKVADRIHDSTASLESLCYVQIQTARDRDRRSNPLNAARHLVNSLKSYLMAQEVPLDRFENP